MTAGPRHAHEGDDEGIPPDRSPNSRRLPAGQVLVVMLLALGLGALLNAHRMVERVEAKPFDEDLRDQKLWAWERVEDLAGLTLLDVPRERAEAAVDPVLGRDESGYEDLDVEEIAARRTAERPAASGDDPDPGSASVGSGEGSGDDTTTTTEPDLTPEIRTPTAEEPLRFWVGGDSMTETFGTSMQRVASSTGVIDAALDYRVSTGLTRPDFFNWPAHLANDVLPTDPEVVVIMFGANDSQGIELEDGTVCRRFEQCWLDEYRRRVGATMDLMRDPDNDRIVFWVGQPIMGPGSGVHGMDKLNHIYWDEARTRDWVVYFDSWPYFADGSGNFANSLPGRDGTVNPMRQPDNVHLSTQGGDRLSWEILERMGEHLDLSNSTAQPSPSLTPPDEITEREEIPPAEPELL